MPFHHRCAPLALSVLLTLSAPAAPLDDAKQLASQNRHAEAIVQFDEALKVDPKLAEAHAGKAASLLAIQRPDEARDAITQALSLRDDPGFHMIAGRIHVAKNEFDPARQRYDQAAKLSPKKAGTIYADLAAALTAKNDSKLAPQIDAALNAAVSADPPHLDSLFHLGQSNVSAGREEGRTYLNRYLAEANKLPEKQRDPRKIQLAKQMIRALDILKTGK